MTIQEREADGKMLEKLLEQLESLYRQLRYGDRGDAGMLLRAGRTLDLANLGMKYGLHDLPPRVQWPEIEKYVNELRQAIKQ
jgi:flagellar biosynthesis/type III secretory pathway chaperone